MAGIWLKLSSLICLGRRSEVHVLPLPFLLRLINRLGIVFIMALNAQRPPDTLPVDPKQVAADVETLHSAAKKREEVRLLTTLW